MRVGILGLGLIGGSVALRWAPLHEVVAWDTDPATRDLAAAAGLTVAPPEDVDVLVLATPMHALPETLASTAEGLVVTDVGSVKAPVLAAAQKNGVRRFVGGHPMAGVERTGFPAADPTLLDGAVWVLCLEDDTDLEAWLTVAELVTGAGCRVLPTTAAAHDEAQARISGLPHLLASALAVAGHDGGPLAGALAAGSFRDGTRVAGSRAAFTAALCDGNRAALAEVLAGTIDRLREAHAALSTGGTVLPLAEAGHAARHAWYDPAPAAATTFDRGSTTLRDDLLAYGAAGGVLDLVTATALHGRRHTR